MIKSVRKPGYFSSYVARNRASSGYLLRANIFKLFGGLCRLILLFGLCFMILQPLLNQLSLSLMSTADLYDPAVVSVPRVATLANFRVAADAMDYWTSLLRTLGITLLVAVMQIIACTITGYGFARFNFPFKRFCFICVLLTIIVPPTTIMAPLFMNFMFFDPFGLVSLFNGQPVNLLNTLTGYLILVATGMGLRSGLYVFMIRQYFRNMPRELEDAAYVDGCSTFRTFVQIMLPDAKPILGACFLFAFVWQWTDGFYASLFLRGQGIMALQLGSLADRFREAHSAMYGVGATMGATQQMIATGMLMAVAPLIILYVFTQRIFVESIGQTGLKM